MTIKPSTKPSLYLINLLVFIGLGIHFILLNDKFYTSLLFFNALVNLIAFFQIPQKVSNQSIFLNFFNGLLLLITVYTYSEHNIQSMLLITSLLAATYLIASFRQYYLRAAYRKHKKRRQKKFK